MRAEARADKIKKAEQTLPFREFSQHCLGVARQLLNLNDAKMRPFINDLSGCET
jgi:hypothetical protein